MLTGRITGTVLTGSIADMAMPDITGGEFQDDQLLTILARLLLGSRKQKLRMGCYRMENSGNDETKQGIRRAIEEAEPDLLAFYSLDDAALIDDLHQEGAMPGFVTATPVENFLASLSTNTQGGVGCWISRERRVTFLMMKDVNMARYHIAVSLLSALVPWCFDEQPITQDETQFLCKVGRKETTTAEFLAEVDERAAIYDLQTATKKYYLTGYEDAYRKDRIRELENELNTLRQNIVTQNEKMNHLYDQKALCDRELVGLRYSPEKESKLLDFFLTNPQLYLEEKDGRNLTYDVGTTLSSWDPEEYDRMRENHNSYLYETYSEVDRPNVTQEEYLAVMDGLFRDESIKLLMVARWSLSDTGRLSPYQDTKYPPRFAQYLPNPHLYHYGCMGTFRSDLANVCSRRDFVMAVDTTCAETGNLNLRDGAVGPAFIRDLLKTDQHCIQTPDGEALTVPEAAAFLMNK